MLDLLKLRLDAVGRRFRDARGGDLSTPAGRRAAFWHFHLLDHGLLRMLWTNMDEIAPGVWRSNQPDPRRLRRCRDMGIRTVISLRGSTPSSNLRIEREACHALGLKLITIRLQSRSLPPRSRLLRLLDIFEAVDRPLLMHCKSGSDRSGLASALYLMHMEGRPVAKARKMLSWRYLHNRHSVTGVLDRLLDSYAADAARTPLPIRDWIATRYDPVAIQSDFESARGGRRAPHRGRSS